MFDKNQSFHVSFIVEKCSIGNGGCDASAVCSNPKAVGENVVCSCGAGEQFGPDGRTCTSINEAEKFCPTSTCWTYEMVEGTKKCVMKLRVWNLKFEQSAARSEKSPQTPSNLQSILTTFKVVRETKFSFKYFSDVSHYFSNKNPFRI